MGKPKLQATHRNILERYKVIEVQSVPAVEKLAETIAALGGSYTLQAQAGGVAVAKVTIQGKGFDGASDHEGQALVEALCMALVATQANQGSLFDDDGDETPIPGSRLISREEADAERFASVAR